MSLFDHLFGRLHLWLETPEAVEEEIRDAREAGFDVYRLYDENGLTPFMRVCEGDYPDAVVDGFLNAATKSDMLVAQDGTGDSILKIAVDVQVGTARKILKHPRFPVELVNLADKFGRTPLHVAEIHGLGDMLQLLLQAGAHVNLADKG